MPFFSIVRNALVEMRRLIQRFSPSSQKRCVCRFGRKRRRFLLLACETRFPTAGFLPVTSQTRDILSSLRKSIIYVSHGGTRERARLYISRALDKQHLQVT